MSEVPTKPRSALALPETKIKLIGQGVGLSSGDATPNYVVSGKATPGNVSGCATPLGGGDAGKASADLESAVRGAFEAHGI